jgi:hypothetical protein
VSKQPVIVRPRWAVAPVPDQLYLKPDGQGFQAELLLHSDRKFTIQAAVLEPGGESVPFNLMVDQDTSQRIRIVLPRWNPDYKLLRIDTDHVVQSQTRIPVYCLAPGTEVH